MKVLLLEDVKGFGRRMEVKNASDGYARNFLIARKLAVPADDVAMSLKKQSETRESALTEKWKSQADKLKKDTLEFAVKTGEKGYQGEVLLSEPLKIIGEHKVAVSFPRGIRGEARVIMKRAL